MLNDDPTPVQVQRANLWTPKYTVSTKQRKKKIAPMATFNFESRTPKQKLFVIFFYLQDSLESTPFQQIKHIFSKLTWQSQCLARGFA